MKLREYTPDQLLLDNESTKATVENYEKQILLQSQKNQYRDNTIVFVFNFLVSALSLIPSISRQILWLLVACCVVLIALLALIIVFACKWYDCSKEYNKNKINNKLFEQLREYSLKGMKYTGIVRVVIVQDDTVKYLVDSRYFLPHFNLDSSQQPEEQEFGLKQALFDDFKIKKRDIIDTRLVDEKIYFSIKPIHNQLVMNAYVFYDVQINVQTKNNYLRRLSWMSLSEMKDNATAMGNNKDVIEILESSLSTPKDSFANIMGKVKVIWNITSKCNHACKICATYDAKRNELSTEEKLKVLNDLCEAKELIKSIDFAGGDPFCSKDSIQIIQNAVQQFGEDRISVTTTGIGLHNLHTKNPMTSIKNYEVTIDAAHDNLSVGHNKQIGRDAKEYISENLEQLKELPNFAEHITINVPIINTDLSNEEIDNLVNQILSIQGYCTHTQLEVLLLRLMPVGKAGSIMSRNVYKQYNPLPVITKITEKLKQNNIKYKLHCSLRFFYNENDDYCNMLENKIGIDCAGNVFACAWGGYFKSNLSIDENPFFLGNLTKTKIIDILQGIVCTEGYKSIATEIKLKRRRKFCSVVSYYASTYSKKKIFENEDPLALTKNNRKK